MRIAAQPRDRAGHRQRRLEGDRRRAGGPLRHDRDRLRGHERQRPDLRRRRAAGACSTTWRSSAPTRSCWREIAIGLRAGAEAAGIEIPGGEVCQLPEVIRGHPSPYGFDLVGSAFGTVALDRDHRRQRVRPWRRTDRPAGVRRALQRAHPGPPRAARAGRPDARLSAPRSSAAPPLPTPCSSRPPSTCARSSAAAATSEVDVHGLAHITGGGLSTCCGSATASASRSRDPLPRPASLRADRQARRGQRRPRCGRCSTWAAASAWSSAPTRRTPRLRTAGRAPPRHGGDRTRHRPRGRGRSPGLRARGDLDGLGGA